MPKTYSAWLLQHADLLKLLQCSLKRVDYVIACAHRNVRLCCRHTRLLCWLMISLF
jgi:hypothetical protein